jgi:hypothetical protein
LLICQPVTDAIDDCERCFRRWRWPAGVGGQRQPQLNNRPILRMFLAVHPNDPGSSPEKLSGLARKAPRSTRLSTSFREWNAELIDADRVNHPNHA